MFDKKKKVNIGSIGFFVFISYIVYIWLCELLDLVCFLMSAPQCSIISRLVVVIIELLVIWKLKDKLEIEKNQITPIMIISAIFILAFGFFKCVIPDGSADTFNYHLLAQEPGFENNFTYNVAPGYFQLWGFRLADRLYYVFRHFLGYRAGTVFNSVIMILIYFQMVYLIKLVAGSNLEKIREKLNKSWYTKVLKVLFRADILAFGITFIYDMVMQTGIYMVEIVTIPIALELFRCLILADKNEDAIYFSFLTGIFFTLKMTNVVYIIPMTVLLILKVCKKLNIKVIISCVALGCLPVFVYLIYNMSTTGNPVFPYYNSIFKSGFFSLDNFKDTRWGPSNLKETFLWVYYILFKNEYRQSEIANEASLTFVGMFVAAIYYAIKCIRKRKWNKDLFMVLTFLGSYILWTITTGHTRYFMVGFLFGGIILVCFYAEVINKCKFKIVWLFAACLMFFACLQPAYAFKSVAHGREWSWRDSVNNKEAREANSKYLFKDQQFGTNQQIKKIDAFVLSSFYGGSYADLIKSDVPIAAKLYLPNISDENKRKDAEQYINRLFEEKENVYDIWQYQLGGAEQFVENLNNNGYYIEQIEKLDSSFVNGNTLALIKINNLNKKNEYFIQGQQIPLEAGSMKFQMNAIVGNVMSKGLCTDPLCYELYVSDGQNEYQVERRGIEEGQWIDEKIDIDCSGYQLGDNRYIYFKYVDANGIEIVDPCKLYIINPKVTKK